jgi:V/A-type H+-transporting ATPase subunit D
MAKLNVAQTKSSLRKIKEELAFAREGHDLLNQKRELLALEVVRRLNEIRKIESAFLNGLSDLYNAYESAALDMGAQEVTIKRCSEREAYALQRKFIKLMGLKLPAISLTLSPPAPPGGMAQTAASY